MHQKNGPWIPTFAKYLHRGSEKGGVSLFRPTIQVFVCSIIKDLLLIYLYRYIVSRQGRRQDEKGAVYVKGSRWELFADHDETTTIPASSATGATGTEICDCNEEVDSAERIAVDTRTKGAGENFESVELPSMGSSRPPSKRGKWEPTRIAESTVEKIQEMLETYIYSPPASIANSIYWVNDPKCKFISPTTPEFQQALNNWQTILSHWNYDQFKNFYKIQRHYIFRRGVNYHSIEDSFKYAKQWLEEQAQVATLCVYEGFGYIRKEITPQQLLQKFSNVVNRREKKKFGIVLQGTNSCGKTWFTNMILDFFINKGELQNWNRYMNANFPFMGLVNRRIALWNEGRLNGDDMQLEDLKVLLEGESKTVSVKNQKDGCVISTPFIITTNHVMFEKSTSFKDRLTIVNIDKVPMLHGGDDCPGRLAIHPFAFAKLIDHYSIETDEAVSDVAQEITSL